MEGAAQPRSEDVALPAAADATKLSVGPERDNDQNDDQNDEQLMSLVELALDMPAAEREPYLQEACAGNAELLSRARHYVEAEQRMRGFMLEPLFEMGQPENPFAAGNLIDNRFRIIGEVARGGMGIVYDAYDERLDRRIAIKCAKRGFRKRLSPEVRNASEISHPNVCKIFEMHTATLPEGQLDFITMEFLEGETLAERLEHGPLQAEEADLIARQLCSGLAQAHRTQVIHGDLKSNNIILTKTAKGATRAVITDFGLARRPQSSLPAVQSGTMGGTPDYMAPELWRGEKASVASDIYALGVILYELACGRRPFSQEALPSNQASSPASKPSGTKSAGRPFEKTHGKPPAAHPQWDRILARCLDPDPAKRFEDADDIVKTLAPARPKRNYALAAVGIAVGILASAVLGTVAYQRMATAADPIQSIRLAMLPFTADAAIAASFSQGVLLDTGDRLAHVGYKGGRTRLTVIPLTEALKNTVLGPEKAKDALGATHSLSGTLRQLDGRVLLHAILTDSNTHATLKELDGNYASNELDQIPVAMAGMVTGTLHLPALSVAAAATVSPAAYSDWAQGVAIFRANPGNVDTALNLLEHAVAADPRSPLTHARLAEARLIKYHNTADSNWWNLARTSLKQAEQLNPDIALVRSVSANLNQQAGNSDQAEADLKRALELEPMNGDYWRQLGTVYGQKHPVEADAAFRKAIELQPEYFRNYGELGSFYMDSYSFEKAVEQFKKMVDAAPGLPEAHFGLARPYLAMDDYPNAERESRRAMELRENSNAVHNLAVLLSLQNRLQEAVPYFQKALDLGPPPDNKYLLYLNFGSAYRRLGDRANAQGMYLKAQKYAHELLNRNALDPKVHARLAFVEAQLGNDDDARSRTLTALSLARSDMNVRWIAIQTYDALRDGDSAIDLLKDAPDQFLRRVNLYPELAGLKKNPRFTELLTLRHLQKEN